MRNDVLMRGLILGIIILFLMTSILPGIYANTEIDINKSDDNHPNENLVPLDQLDQQVINEDGYIGVLPPDKMAQSFKPTLNTLTRIEIVAMEDSPNCPGNLLISIRSTLSGTDLTSTSIPANSVPRSGSWVEFDFPDISVIPEQTYFIIFHADASWTSSNLLAWGVHAGNLYTRGEPWGYDGTRGVWWKFTPDFDFDDFCFKTYGYNSDVNHNPSTPSKPSGPTSGNTGISYTFSTSTTDFDNDNVKYGWDWDGDSSVDQWDDNNGSYYTSGTTISTVHTWNIVGTYDVKVKAEDEHGALSDWSPALSVEITPNRPPDPPIITGPVEGKTGRVTYYNFTSIDLDTDQIFYFVEWGDSTNSSWIGPYPSGALITESHAWTAKGEYVIKAKAKDIHESESNWSDPLPITMPYIYKPPLLQFLELLFQRVPNAFPILRQLLGY
ncbi:Uncharacterised protein [uncultured archaeon]|nr:Uncharacterised protein [uncultured archaeon]